MTKLDKEAMRIYQNDRRARIRGGGAVQTVAGVLALVRKVEKRVDRLETWLEEMGREG